MKNNGSRGFSIIELVIAVTLLAILIAVAAPSFSGFVQRQRVLSQTELISSALNTARSEALSQLQTVRVCWNPETAGANATPNGLSIAPGNLAVIRLNDPLDLTDVELVQNIEYDPINLFIDDNDDDCINFTPQGRLDLSTVSGSNTNFLFGVCLSDGDDSDSRSISVSSTGRALTQENEGGTQIDCT